MKISLLVAHHKKGPFLSSKYITPIQVGSALNEEIGFITDATGINISQKNKNYCELTAQYWAWKNHLQNYDYFGFMHYRRYFMFKQNWRFKKNIIDDFDTETINEFGLNDLSISNAITNYDIILPPVWPVHPPKMRKQIMSIYDLYAHEHIKTDMDTALQVIKEIYPEYTKALEKVMNSKNAYYLNMFIMNKKYFDEYMHWIFSILFEVEKRITISSDPYQARVFGFLSERLINVFINFVIERDNPKIKELPIAFCRFEPSLKQSNRANKIKVAFKKIKSIKRYVHWKTL